jgi:hypothetical protein
LSNAIRQDAFEDANCQQKVWPHESAEKAVLNVNLDQMHPKAGLPDFFHRSSPNSNLNHPLLDGG